MFQGSTAKSLAIYQIKETAATDDIEETDDTEETDDAEESDDTEETYDTEKTDDDDTHDIKWRRGFDYDIMHIKNIEVIDEESEYFKMNANEIMQKEEWEKAKFCKHGEEPYVILRIRDEKDEHGILPEHVYMMQPACKKCVDSDELQNEFSENLTNTYYKRITRLKTPHKFWMKFAKNIMTHPAEEN